MSDSILYSGSCFCGEVEFAVIAEPIGRCECHCTVCQRLSGGPSCLVARFPGQDSLKVVKGNDMLTEVITSEEMNRYFCSLCGANMNAITAEHSYCALSSLKRDDDGKIIHLDRLAPTVHIFYSDRIQNVIDDKPKFATYPSGEPLMIDEKGNVIGE
jgi:hypothetical protein